MSQELYVLVPLFALCGAGLGLGLMLQTRDIVLQRGRLWGILLNYSSVLIFGGLLYYTKKHWEWVISAFVLSLSLSLGLVVLARKKLLR